MKIIHCADLHLDSKMTANLDNIKAKERKNELLDTYIRMVKYAKDHEVSAILICGDMFDTKNVSNLTRNAVLNSITSNPEIMFFYLRGNHDSESFINMLEEVPCNLYLFEDEFAAYPLKDDDSIYLYGAELTKENSGNIQIKFSPDPSKMNIVMLHGQETETASKDKAEIVNIRAFKNKGVDYLALGHIHEYKCESLDARGFYCYSGCLEGRGFDECGKHGFVVLDIDTDTRKIESTFIPFAKRELFQVSVDISEALTSIEIIEKVRKSLNECDATDKDLVKIELTGCVDVSCEKDIDFILHEFKKGYYFVKIKDESVIKVNYEDYLLDESLKGEFVRLCNNEDLSEEEKGEIIRLGLSVLQGGKIEL